MFALTLFYLFGIVLYKQVAAYLVFCFQAAEKHVTAEETVQQLQAQVHDLQAELNRVRHWRLDYILMRIFSVHDFLIRQYSIQRPHHTPFHLTEFGWERAIGN